MNADATYAELRQVVEETFSLWDVTRIGFSWRKYYLDHTLQVQNLALRMARELDGDPEQLRQAAILHDITKRWDGAVLKDASGNTVLDSEGFWLNETVDPARANWVTQLYADLGLERQVHHLSGAALAEHVLREFGAAENHVRPVAKIVRGHLKGRVAPEVHDERYREIEVRILYDADTIDPNAGLTAFYRNVQINAGYALQSGEPVDVLAYVEKLPRWIGMKEHYPDQLLTDLGREIFRTRHARCVELVRNLQAEAADPVVNRKYGLLGVVEHLFTNAEDPSLREHAASLTNWLLDRAQVLAGENELDRDAAAQAHSRARTFLGTLLAEMEHGL